MKASRELCILHITPHLGGGIGKAVIGISELALKEGMTTKIILLEKPEKTDIVCRAQQNGLHVVLEPNDEMINRYVSEADVVVIDWWDHPLISELLTKLKIECRIIIWCHTNGCVYPFHNPSFLLQFDEILFTSPYSDENVLWSRSEKREIITKRSIVYGLGNFEPLSYHPKDNSADDVGDKLVIGYAGTLSFSKMHPEFVDFCDSISDIVQNVEFHFAGDMVEPLKTQLSISNHRAKYFWDGFVTDMDEWFRSIDVFLYLLSPDHYGTTENVVLEAMAYGIPVILMDGIFERGISGNGEGAILISNISDAVKELSKLYSIQQYRVERGIRAREFVIKGYSAKQNTTHYCDVIVKLIQKKKTVHNFAEVIGKGGWDYFIAFTGPDKKVFEKFINDNEEAPLIQLLNKKRIYLSKTKSSIYHFYKYYPEDKNIKKLKQLADMMLAYGEGEAIDGNA